MSDDLCPTCGAYWACECLRADAESAPGFDALDPDEWYHLGREFVVQTERLRRIAAHWVRADMGRPAPSLAV